MKLAKFKVTNFRSIKDSGWIDIDDWACLVGMNESGKSNLLLALWRFNPLGGSMINFASDYPKGEHSSNPALAIDTLKKDYFIEILFELNDDEKNRYNNFIDESNYRAKTYDAMAGNNFNKFYNQRTPSGHIVVKVNFKDEDFVFSSNADALYREHNPIPASAVVPSILAFPKFIYYPDYKNLDSNIDFSKTVPFLNATNSPPEEVRTQFETLVTLFNFLGFNPKEVYDLGKDADNPDIKSQNMKAREKMMEDASKTLTQKFNAWWQQGDYIFRLKLDGKFFRIYVSDDENKDEVELENRSAGLILALNLFLIFSTESEKNNDNCIFLLDEPGLKLHPARQADLMKLLQDLSKKNQLIYTTHSPFLIDNNHLEKVKAVYIEDHFTKVSSDLRVGIEGNKSIQPVFAAIGMTTAESLLLGCDIVIVEGASDQFYLTMIKNYLVSVGFKMNNDIVFIPARGAPSIRSIISVLHGSSDGELPYTLFDSDKEGVDNKNDLQNGLYQSNKNKVLEYGNFIDKEDAEVEDIIPQKCIVDAFKIYFESKTDHDISTHVIPTDNKNMVTALEDFATNEFKINLGGDVGWKVEVARIVKKNFEYKDVDKYYKSIWKDLFNAFQGNEAETAT